MRALAPRRLRYPIVLLTDLQHFPVQLKEYE
jgi:hypothetical protein